MMLSIPATRLDATKTLEIETFLDGGGGRGRPEKLGKNDE